MAYNNPFREAERILKGREQEPVTTNDKYEEQ